MKRKQILALIIALVVGFNVTAQTKKKKTSTKKNIKTTTQTTTTVTTTVTDSPVVTEVKVQPAIKPPAPSIMKYLVNSYPEYTVLVKAINATELNSTFEAAGPVTVFAPVNKTFNNASASTMRDIMEPQMRDSLKGILTYIIVAGNWRKEDLIQKIKEGGGSYSLPTIGGMGNLSFVLNGETVSVKDNRGNQIPLGTPVMTNSGMVYAIDRLLLP